MRLPLYQVDAFTSEVFRGNPAAVCPLETWLPDATMQAIAAENNLAETAFFVPTGPAQYHLRWFTPEVEVDLCGHATLASAAVLYEKLGQTAPAVTFDTRSGALTVAREAGAYTLDLPARRPGRCRAIDRWRWRSAASRTSSGWRATAWPSTRRRPRCARWRPTWPS